MIYSSKKVYICGTEEKDLKIIASNLREADKREIKASHNLEPMEALELCLKNCVICLTAFYDKEPVAIFGLHAVPHAKDVASVWLLGTTKLDSHKVTFCKLGKKIINAFLRQYKFLYNFVDVRNEQSISWIKYLGATFSAPAPYGPEELPFQYFVFERV